MYGLDSVHIRVPQAVALGSSAVLICECDLPDEDLYSVKWYKGKHEFFRYTSKEIPSIKIFPKAGINVNVSIGGTQLILLLQNVELTGRSLQRKPRDPGQRGTTHQREVQLRGDRGGTLLPH